MEYAASNRPGKKARKVSDVAHRVAELMVALQALLDANEAAIALNPTELAEHLGSSWEAMRLRQGTFPALKHFITLTLEHLDEVATKDILRWQAARAAGPVCSCCKGGSE